MRFKQIVYLSMVLLILIMIGVPLLAQHSDQEETGDFKHQVSTEGLSGISFMLVELYNNNRLLYALVSTASMALLGGIIALTVDFILARLGLTVSKMEHRE